MRIDWKNHRAWALATIACLHATFLRPYVILVHSERTNVLTSLLALLPLLPLAFSRLHTLMDVREVLRAALPWMVLACGLVASALASAQPGPALWRVLSFVGPAAAGLACGQLLFNTPQARRYMFGLLTFCFAWLSLSHLALGAMPSYLGLWHHALAGTLVLLAAGPLYFSGTGGRAVRAGAVALLLAGALACFLAGSRFVILLPFALIPVYVALRSLSLRLAVMALASSAVVAGVFFTVFPAKVMGTVNYESTFYRVESYPATWEIVKVYPLLGLGIRTPRRDILASYEPRSGLVSREGFLAVVDRNVTWDNQYLSLLCDIGVLFTLLYLYLAGRPLSAYLRRAWRQEIDHATERALTFALLASVIHFAVHDGLFYPQINWFFHLLLGVGAALANTPASATLQADGQPAASSTGQAEHALAAGQVRQ